ncbi:MAG: response regulator [Chloroflexi bacterium]|nr:response regulator [Chloroflexota bacterium]
MDLTGKRIFIVEDDTRNRVIYQIMMVRHGAQVHFDKWGRNTVEKIKEFGKVDLIILDLMITGGTSGFTIFKEIRREHEFDYIPIVAVSAADPSTAIPRAQEMGFTGYISKPIDDDLFPEQLWRIMNGEQVWYVGT